MTVIYTLLVAHFVADFIAQSDWMALNKSKRWDALAIHVIVYTGAVGAVVSVVHGLPESTGYFFTVNALAHFVQDAITSRITSRLWFLILTPTGDTGKIWRGAGNGGVRVEPLYAMEDTGTRHWFFVAIGFDQLLHYVTLFVTAGWWLQ